MRIQDQHKKNPITSHLKSKSATSRPSPWATRRARIHRRLHPPMMKTVLRWRPEATLATHEAGMEGNI